MELTEKFRDEYLVITSKELIHVSYRKTSSYI